NAVFDFIQSVEDQMEIVNASEHDVVLGLKHLLTGEAREWFRLVEHDIRTWYEFCRKFRKEFLPRDYVENALERLKQFKQSVGETVTIFIARFIQKAQFLPTPLAEKEKLKILRRNILPFYQEKLWDKEIDSVQQL